MVVDDNDKNEKEVVIRRKRKRTAVDPCLGYYTHDDEYNLERDSLNSSKNKDVDRETTSIILSSDSLQDITSPLSSDETSLCSVDKFFRQQVSNHNSSSKTCLRERKNQQIPQFFSDDDQDGEMEAVSSNKAVQTISKETHDLLPRVYRTNPNTNAGKRTLKKIIIPGFSSRIHKAAILSGVELRTKLTPQAPPLPLVTYSGSSLPIPPRNKRVKLVDPHIPRVLESAFMNEWSPTAKSQHLPFSNWSVTRPRFVSATATYTIGSKAKYTTHQSRQIKPLTLVPYDDFDRFRKGEYGKKLKRRNRQLELSCNEDSRPSPRRQEKGLSNSSLFSSMPTTLVPDTPPFSPLPTTDNDRRNVPVLGTIGHDRAGDCGTQMPIHKQHRDSASGYHIREPNLSRSHSNSQRPLRGIGSMLGTLRETARSLLLSQSQQ